MKSPLTPLLPVLLLSVLVLLTASSCTSLRVSPISETLSAADSLMMTDPQSDTSVFFSSEYYRRHGPDSLYARALMMCGAVHAENGDPSSALEKYKAAEPVMEAVGDYEQLGLLHTNVGALYQSTLTDNAASIQRYRMALDCFEKGDVYERLAPAYLTLARVLLGDSTERALPCIMSGIKSARAQNDSLWMAVGSELLTWYYMYEEEYATAVRTATDAIATLNPPPAIKSILATALSFAFLALDQHDSVRVYLPLLPRESAADSTSYLRIMYQLAMEEHDLERALTIKDSIMTLELSILEKGKNLDLQKAEQYYNTRYEKMAAENRSRRYVISFLTFLICASSVCLAAISYFFRTIYRQKQELSEVSDMFLQLLDRLLYSYQKHSQPEKFYETVEGLVREMFRSEDSGTKIRRITEILYPGFLAYLHRRYASLTEKDLLIIALDLCRFSTRSMTVISGRNENALYTAKSRIAQKTGHGVSFSEFIDRELSSYQAFKAKSL